MKKLIATILCITMSLSVSSMSAFAWAPTNFRDPKCINLNGLGTEQTYISYENKKICGCKTCTIDAFTYDELEAYLQRLKDDLDILDKAVSKNVQSAINWETGKYAAINVVFLTDSVAAKFNEEVRGENANPWFKRIYGVIMVGSAVVAFICQSIQGHFETLVLEDKVKLINIEHILRTLSDKIEKKLYQKMNFVLISTNYNPNESAAIAQFAKKDDIETADYYGVNYYDEEYFNKINKEKIKPLITQIENGVFRQYENVLYDTKYRDFFKDKIKYTFTAAALNEGLNLYKKHKSQIDPVLKDKTKNLFEISGKVGKRLQVFAEKHKLSIERLRALLNFISQESGKSNNLIMKGIHWVSGAITIILPSDKDTNDGEETSNTDKTSKDEKIQTSKSTKNKFKTEKIDISGSTSAIVA